MKIPIASSGLETVLEKVGRSLSERFGIRVVCQGARCCTNGRAIFLPSLPDELPPAMLQIIRGYLDHEAGHIVGKSNFRILKWFKEKYGADASLFLNMLEDLRIEELMRQRFPGSRKNLAAAYTYLAEEVRKSAEPVPVWRQLAFGIHAHGNRLPAPPFVGAEVLHALSMIPDAILKAPRCRNTSGVARLAESAWPLISHLFPPPQSSSPDDSPTAEQSRPSSQPGQDAVNADTEDSTGTDDDDTQEDEPDSGQTVAQADASQIAAGGHVGGAPSAQSDDDEVDGTQTTRPDADDHAGASAPDIMRDLAGAISAMVNDYSRTTRAYRVWTTELDTVRTAPDNPSIPHHRRMAALLPHVAGVRQKLLQTLLAEPKARWLGDKEAGRINPRALYRLATSREESSGAERVFRERVRTKRLHTAVTLLVDQSSSMDGQKIKLAANTALVFCEALSRLDIPCAVVGFSTGEPDCYEVDTEAKTGMSFEELVSSYRIAPLRHTHFKRFDESFRSTSGRFDHMRSQYLTPLGESILFAARELAARREERKVLFVLTDGRPEVGLHDDAATFQHAKDSIKRVEKAGIDVALVGILENCVADLHHRSVVVNSLDQLPKTVMRQLQSLLANNHRHIQ